MSFKEDISYKELASLYDRYFSLGYIGGNDLSNRLALISLICYVTYKAKQKNPDVTHYQIIVKISDKMGLPEDFIKGLSIVCESMSYSCTEFPTFGLKGQEIIKKIQSIFNTFLPF